MFNVFKKIMVLHRISHINVIGHDISNTTMCRGGLVGRHVTIKLAQ